jgi:hypothetical protein
MLSSLLSIWIVLKRFMEEKQPQRDPEGDWGSELISPRLCKKLLTHMSVILSPESLDTPCTGLPYRKPSPWDVGAVDEVKAWRSHAGGTGWRPHGLVATSPPLKRRALASWCWPAGSRWNDRHVVILTSIWGRWGGLSP